jgi:hypothetical protein
VRLTVGESDLVIESNDGRTGVLWVFTFDG